MPIRIRSGFQFIVCSIQLFVVCEEEEEITGTRYKYGQDPFCCLQPHNFAATSNTKMSIFVFFFDKENKPIVRSLVKSGSWLLYIYYKSYSCSNKIFDKDYKDTK